MNATTDDNKYIYFALLMICTFSVVLAGAYDAVVCGAVLLIACALMMFVNTGVSRLCMACALVCFGGFFVSDLFSGSGFFAPLEMIKYALLFLPSFIYSENTKKGMGAAAYVGVLITALADASCRVFNISAAAGSFIGYENTAATLYCVGAACALYLAVVRREQRFLHLLCLVLCAVMCICSNSLLLYVCVAVSLVVVMCVRHKKGIYIAAALFAAATIGVAALFASGMENMLITSTVASRLIYWQDALGLILRNPFGIGVYGWENVQYINQSAIYSVKYVHNSMLQLALDGGIFAAAGYMVFAAFGMVRAAICYKKSKKPFYLLILFVILVMFLHSIVDFDNAYGAYLLIMGICAACVSRVGRVRINYCIIVLGIISAAGIYTSFAPARVNEVEALMQQYSEQYACGQYAEAYNTAQELADKAPRQQDSYDALYLSIDKLSKMGYSMYGEECKKLRLSVERINASMNPLCRYLDRHKYIVLPENIESAGSP